LFVDRSGSKEDKQKILKQICERQVLSEQGLLPPIVIEPEGGTNNGDYVTKFMKGAFVGLNSVQPHSFKSHAVWINPSHCMLNVLDHLFLSMADPFTWIHVKIFPVFTPNAYFFEHHWNPASGQEKWEAYANVIRKIIADAHGLKVSDMSFEDKKQYIMQLKGVKTN
jgi:hypothetical protein